MLQDDKNLLQSNRVIIRHSSYHKSFHELDSMVKNLRIAYVSLISISAAAAIAAAAIAAAAFYAAA